VRVLLLGGEPLGETIVMWWNFIGRSHEEVVQYRANWQAQIGAEPVGPGVPAEGSQFGTVLGNTLDPLPAPVLPNARLRPRG
jgi:quercetin 2,3-dioxygenase